MTKTVCLQHDGVFPREELMEKESPFLREQTLTFGDLIKYPPIVETEASIRPLEKILLANFIMLVRPSVIFELGVYKAVTTEFICDFLELNDIPAQVVGFDIPEMITGVRTKAAIQRYEEIGRLQLISGYLPDTLNHWLKSHEQSVDLALVDAMHNYPSVTSELHAIWPRLSDYGVILCHDYFNVAEHEGVMYAVDNFAKRKSDAHVLSLQSSPEASSFEYQGSQEQMYCSVLVALRRRPYKFSYRRLLNHLIREVQWKRNRPRS
jgi:hypothetical protein